MTSWVPQPSFGKGEIAPSLYGRVDLAAYSIGAKFIENFLITRSGGLVNTPGSEFIGEVKDSSQRTRLIPFSFNTTQTYMLEFGNLYMRVIKDGGYVTETAQNITGVTNANPGVLTYSGADPANGDWFYLSGIVGMTQLNGKIVKVAAVNAGANTYQLQEVDGTPINTTSFGTYTSGGTMARIYTIVTPYTTADLPLLKFIQSADVMTFTHRSHAQRELTRTAHDNWTLTTPTFAPAIAAPAITASSFTGAGTAENLFYKATSIDEDTAEESLPTAQYTAAGVTDATWNDGEYMTISGTSPAGASKVNIYKSQNGVYGFVGQAVPSAGTWSFRDTKITPDTLDAPQEERNPFDAAGKYPQASTYYEQRTIYGGSTLRPQGFDTSQSGQYKNFNVSTPLKDDDAISRNIAAQQVNEIRHFVPLRELLILTSGGIWKLSAGGQSDVITPTSMTVRLQSKVGVSHVPPIVIGDSVLYVQEKGSIIRDMGYSFQADNYVGADLSVISSHLFEGREIKEWAYADVPYSIVWAVMDNGQMVTMTYMREQELVGCTHQVTDGEYESVAVISEGQEDSIYCIVKRTIGGQTKRYVERFKSRIVTNPDDAFFVHCGLSYVGSPVATVSGLDHLEGKVVAILADGNVQPQQTVVNGTVTLQVEASKIHIGLPYVSDMETLPVGDTNGGLGRRKKTVKIRARVERSRGMWAGPNRNDMTELKRDPLWSKNLRTEELELMTVPEYAEQSTLVIQQRDPLPLSILALIPEIDV
jgi:hypothetical protein